MIIRLSLLIVIVLVLGGHGQETNSGKMSYFSSSTVTSVPNLTYNLGSYLSVNTCCSKTLCDVDGDGLLDVIGFSTTVVEVYFGNGNGFDASSYLAPSNDYGKLTAGLPT